MTRTPHILWADDEIDLLKPHILFLERKGYEVTGFTDGASLLEALEEDRIVDVVFLDENMPGLTGLETLQRIKERRPHLPCVMITKSEEEHIMEEAIGSKMSDYLIKPLNPSQILLSLKKILDEKRLVGEKARPTVRFSRPERSRDSKGRGKSASESPATPASLAAVPVAVRDRVSVRTSGSRA